MDLGDVIPPRKMFEIIDDLVEMGVQAVTFSGGGEPLIYKQLPECIERLSRGGVKVASLTNGENLTGKMADAFAAHGTWIRISIDAWDGKSYAEARSIGEGKFETVLANMHDFSKRGSDCVLGISFIVSKDNCEHIYQACSLFRDAGVDHVKLSGVVTSNDLAEVNRYHREIKEVVKEQIDRAKALENAEFRVVDRYHELNERFEKSYTSCPNLIYLTVIGADQTVYSCHDKAYAESGYLGSLKDQSFQEFWFSEENRKRIYGLDPSQSCRHHCTAHNKILLMHEMISLNSDHSAFV